jgi:aspartyl-tRNA(Asn)/glutamyl-tRNA(Gln) amidotransferase subunit C
MAKLTKQDVLHVAELAKLSLTEAEVDKFLSQLSVIVEHVGKLNEVDTDNVEPTSQTTGLTNIQREDVVVPSSIDRDGAISGTDNTHNGYFKVKAILTERTDK